MKDGWILLYRKIQDSPFYIEKRTYSRLEAWLDILFEVRWDKEPGKVVIGDTIYYCERGEALYSVRTWARRWGWSESRVHRFLNLLVDGKWISKKAEHLTTRVKVINYEKYQDRGTDEERERNADGDNIKKEKKEKNIYIDLHKKIEYLEQLKGEELTSFTSKYRMSESKVLEVADTMKNYCLSKGKPYKDYRAAMHSWLARESKKGGSSGVPSVTADDHY